MIDAGPVAGTNEINIPYVSVTVCTPGTATTGAACQTIDHVQVDTGSYGLRLLHSSLYSNLNLPAAHHANGQAVGECTSFAIGTTWGSVRLADIYLGGEVARSVPIQDVGDQPGGAMTIPTDCANTGTIQNTQAQLGANGILGVGVFTNDCDSCLTSVVSASYYACTSTGCANSTVTSAQVVKNPVALFTNPITSMPQDNNGVLLVLPAIAAAGASNSLSGSLIFGIGTQANNGLNGASVYATDAYGRIKTTYNNVTLPSYIDSGSNGLFFDDPNIPLCLITTWAYCPASSPMYLSATNSSATGSPIGTFSFSITNTDQLGNNVIAANIGGPSGGNSIWGLPFFFGRSVFTAIAGATTPGGVGPYFAY
jgi:hypothetical protein